MCRYWQTCFCLLLSLSSPLHAAVARAAAVLPLLKPGVVQENYSQQITMTVSGAAPFTYLLGGEDKPEGLLLDPQSGVLHGSPTAAALGTHRLKVIVTDYNGKQTSKDFLLRVTQTAVPAIATPAGTEGSKPVAVVHTAALSNSRAAEPEAEATPLIPKADASVGVADHLVAAAVAPPEQAPPPAPSTPKGSTPAKDSTDTDLDWGLVHAYFVGGILVTNDSSSFSSAHQFYALNLDKTWKLPHCYIQSECANQGSKKLWRKIPGLLDTPGISTYFETRLTSIPVVTNPKGTSSTPMVNFPRVDNGTTDTNDNNFLTSQQTANVGVGLYLPFLLTRWDFNKTPNALFIAPIAKVGFNTLTGATSQNVVLPSNGGTGTASFEQIYNHYDYGFRVGHMGLTNDKEKAPDTYSYLDIGFGRFSNLEDLICHRPDQGGAPSPTGTGCGVYRNPNYTWDSRKRLYRINIEGLLKIPNTIFYVGLNANIGQKEVMAEKVDPAYSAPDDLRFLFGTKFDISKLFTQLGLNK